MGAFGRSKSGESSGKGDGNSNTTSTRSTKSSTSPLVLPDDQLSEGMKRRRLEKHRSSERKSRMSGIADLDLHMDESVSMDDVPELADLPDAMRSTMQSTLHSMTGTECSIVITHGLKVKFV